MDKTPVPDAVWADLATLAFELLAKPDDAARADVDNDAAAADEQEGEQ